MREAPGGVSPVPREARPYQGQRAGLVTRTLAGTVDILVVAAALAIGYAGWIGLRFVLDPRGFDFTGLRPLPGVTWALVLLVVYLTAAWSVTGRTYGGHVMGLRLVDRRGRHPGLLAASARAVLCALFPIGLVWCVVGPTRRSVRRTRCVPSSESPGYRSPTGTAGCSASSPIGTCASKWISADLFVR